jgi:DNA-binding transcriptional LysR family regulator
MNLKRLQAFRAVFEAGSVTRAAERLHTTQPALSRLISDLEAELGLALFVRQRRRLVPTAEGRTFYREAEKALAAVDHIVDIARDIRTLKGAHLRIVAPMLTAFSILPAAIAAFRGSHPHARVSLDIKDLRDIADWVANGPFDVGVTALPFEDARVECELFTTVPAVLVLPKRHPLATKHVIQLKDLRGEAMILPSVGNPPRNNIDAAFESVGVKPQSTIDTSSAFSVCQLVARRLGLGVVDPFTFELASGLGLVARPVRPVIEFPFGFFFPRQRPRSALVTSFLLAVRSAAGSASSSERYRSRRPASLARPRLYGNRITRQV